MPKKKKNPDKIEMPGAPELGPAALAQKSKDKKAKGKNPAAAKSISSNAITTATTLDVEITVLPPSPAKGVHPSMHFDKLTKQSPKMYFGFALPVELDGGYGNKKKKMVNCLVSDTGETIPCIKSVLEKEGINLMAPALINTKEGNRISNKVIEQFIRSKGMQPRPWPIPDWLEFVKNTYSEMLSFSDDRYCTYAALWTFGTYCHRLFDSYPYNFFNGPTGTGKTRVLEVLEQTCYNATLTPNLSPPALFRLVESMSPTLLMDEVEKIWSTDKSQEIRQVVLSGYKLGASVLRCEKGANDTFITNTFSTYSPKGFANISGLDDVLGNRCITVLMARAKLDDDVMFARLRTSARLMKWQDICDQSYLLVYEHWKEIAKMVENAADKEIVQGISGRPLELWFSIFILADLFERHGCVGIKDEMYSLAREQVEDIQRNFRDSTAGQLIRAMRELLMDDPQEPFKDDYYRFQDLIPKVALQATFAEEGIEEDEQGKKHLTVKIKKPRWLTPAYLTRNLRLLGLKDFKGSGSGRSVFLSKDIIKDLWERYMGEWEEPEFAPAQTALSENGQWQDSDREKAQGPPLTTDVIKVVMGDRLSWVFADLRDAVIANGYDRDEFEELFNAMIEEGIAEATGATPVRYSLSNGDDDD